MRVIKISERGWEREEGGTADGKEKKEEDRNE